MQRVVAVFGIQADLNVILGPAMSSENLFHLVAEIAFDFEDYAADLPLGVLGLVGDELLNAGIHAATRLAGSNRADNGDPGEKPALRDDEPAWCFRWHGLTGVVNLAENEKHIVALTRIGVARQSPGCDLSVRPQRENIKAREKH